MTLPLFESKRLFDSRASGNRTVQHALLLCRWTRAPELPQLAAAPVFGFVLVNAQVFSLSELALFLVATFTMSAHVMAVNTLLGGTFSIADIGAIDFPLQRGEWRPRQLRLLGLILLTCSLIALTLLSARAFYLGATIALLWLLYAHPGTMLKGRAGMDTAVHLLAGYLQFLVGAYCLSADLGDAQFEWATFFALVFTAGHFHHVIKDLVPDREAGIGTIGQRIGARSCLRLGSLSFLAAWIVLGLAAWASFHSVALTCFLAALFNMHIVLAVHSAGAIVGGDRPALLLYRRQYRAIFFLIGILLIWQLLPTLHRLL